MESKRSVQGFSIETLRGKTGSFNVNKEKNTNVFRSVLSQFVACTAISLILFDIGLALSYPTLVVSSLLLKNSTSDVYDNSTGFRYNGTDVNGTFSFDQQEDSNMQKESTRDPFLQMSFFKHYTMSEHQTTWYVSVAYICQPIGSIIGGSIIGMTGRKLLMQVLNLFMLAGWLLPYFSTGPIYMYFSNILLGIGIGCCEAPIATYLGEITEVPYRGFLLNLAQMFLSVSFLVPFLVNMLTTSYRWQALFLSTLPVITFLYCLIIPETPAWLISKGRYKDAEKSLRWLRGWTTAENVQDELNEIKSFNEKYSKSSSSDMDADKSTENLTKRTDSIKMNIKYFFSPRMRRPFIIICTQFALLFISGMGAIRPYMGIIFKEIHITMDPNLCAMWVTFAGAVGNLLSIIIIKFTGKRLIVLSALLGNGICTMMIALILMNIVSHKLSFISFLGVSFFSGYGIIPLPWMLQSELYPFRGRGIASGIGAAFCYIVGFISTNVYLELSHLITFQGVFILFTCFSLYGLIYLWFKLPETEGKSFEEIDQYFRDKKR